MTFTKVESDLDLGEFEACLVQMQLPLNFPFQFNMNIDMFKGFAWYHSFRIRRSVTIWANSLKVRRHLTTARINVAPSGQSNTVNTTSPK